MFVIVYKIFLILWISWFWERYRYVGFFKLK